MVKDDIYDKSYKFAVDIVSLYKEIVNDNKEYILSKQLLRSGTSIGANVREARNAQSKKDFLSKMNISLKESVETEYWLDLLSDTKYISPDKAKNYKSKCVELIKILTSIVKSTRHGL